MKQLIDNHKEFVTGGCLGWIALFWAPFLVVAPVTSEPITEELTYLFDLLPYLSILVPAFLIGTLIFSAVLSYLSIKEATKPKQRIINTILLLVAPASFVASAFMTVKYVSAFVL
jgi:hypothetical protein